jgi:MFS family permease
MGELNEIDPRATTGMALLILISVFFYADSSMLFPNYPLITKEFGINKLQMGLVSSISIIVAAAATIFWGVAVDRFSRKNVLVIGVLAGSVPCLLTAFTKSYGQLLFARAFAGVGMSVIIPTTNALIGDYFSPKKRGTALAWFGLAIGIGTLLGVFFAGNLGEMLNWSDTQRWRLPFVFSATPGFLLAPLFYFFAYDPKRGLGEPELRGGLDKKEIKPEWNGLNKVKEIFSLKTNLITFSQGIVGCVPWGILPAWLITFFTESKNFSISSATIIYILLGLGQVCGTLYGGYLGDWAFSRNRTGKIWTAGIFILAGTPATLLILLIPLSGNSGTAALALMGTISALLGSVLAVGGINISSMLMDVNPPENRGTLFSISNLTDSIGRGIGPVLGGFMAIKIGLSMTMNLATLFWIPCGLLVLLLLKFTPREMERLRAEMRQRANTLQ